MISAVVLLVTLAGTVAVRPQSTEEVKHSLEANDTQSFQNATDPPLELRPLWPLTAVVLTAKELEPSGRVQHLSHQLEQLSIPFRVQQGDYAARYDSLLQQFESLSVEPHVRSSWMAGRAQNDLLKQDLVGNANTFCNVAACLQKPNCVCVRDAEALPADSWLSIMATHRQAWQSIATDAASDDDSWHLLLEDDAELLPGTAAAYFSSFQVPKEADIVWLYSGEYQHRCWPGKDEQNVLMSGPVFDTSDYNGVAYAVTKAGAQRLLQHVPQDGSPVDIAMSRAVGSCSLKAFCPPAGRYPVSDSRFQPETTRLALSNENFARDGLPSFLQLTAKGHATGLHEKQQMPEATAVAPRRRVQCS